MTPVARKARATPKIDVLVESNLWNETADVRPVARRAIREAAALLSTAGAELAIVLTDDTAIRLLNRTWRGVDAATNVLSFPTKRAGDDPLLIGDIVLAYETIAGEARTEHKPFAHHVAHLAVHGFLHLLGYDHVRNEDAEVMEQVELDVLRRLAIPNPYRRPARPDTGA
ncbi:MAG TPA: rRNA maturation RNase YbeY [Xanthobacteraceae bacterium]|nr:rRNA maturation RNase YbeY [Xanthobacteraceae bacterium]